MPDLSDVRDALAALATAACYPNGTSAASVTTRKITIGGGWPEPADVDAAMAANASLVSVYAVPGAAAKEDQVFEPPYPVTVPTLGLSAVVTNPGSVALTGAPGLAEYMTIELDGIIAYSVAASAGDTNATIAAALAAKIAVGYPGSSASGGVLSIVGAHAVIARGGAPYTAGQLLHRQRQQFRITVFAPAEPDRKAISAAVDLLFKQNLRLTFNDTSQGILTYENVIEDDASEKFGNFRRGLVYSVSYATMVEFPAYLVTTFGVQSTETVTGHVTNQSF